MSETDSLGEISRDWKVSFFCTKILFVSTSLINLSKDSRYFCGNKYENEEK